MIGLTRLLVVLATTLVASGGTVLAVGLFGSPLTSHDGSDYGLDTNGNGTYDWLVVQAAVVLPGTGYWDIAATLSSSTAPVGGPCSNVYPQPVPLLGNLFAPPSYPISWAYERYFFESGAQTIRFAFAGTDIYRAGVDGPYDVLAHLSIGGGIVYGNIGILPGPMPPVVEWRGVTAAYRATDFEEPFRPAFFTGGHTDSGMHVDDDGLYDFLEIRADVHVNVPGSYSLSGVLTPKIATLQDSWVSPIGYGYREVRLDMRDTSVSLPIRGDQIRMAGIDGPWDLALTLSGGYSYREGYANGTNGTIIDTRPVMYYPEMLCGSTGSHRAADFDDTVELLRYTGVIQELVEDYDGDALYDVLHLRAEVEVIVAAGFDLRGDLQSGDGSRGISTFWAQSWMAEGVAWTDWYFSGGEIRASGLDGPYLATLSMTPTYAGIDPTTTYRTKAYRAVDFEGAATNRSGYWIANMSAAGTPDSGLAIQIEVQRGNDLLAYVIEDTLTTVVYDAARNPLWTMTDRVYLTSGGSLQSFGYKVDGLAQGTYTVVVILGPQDRPVDTRSVSVTL